jgi:galactokinase
MIERLIAHGLSAAEAPRKAALFADTARALSERALSAQSGQRGEVDAHWFVPGRIEVLGKHTDYAGGRSLLCAVERGFCISAAPRTDATLHVTDVRNGVEATFDVSEDQPAETRWRNYVATVARRVARNFPGALRGVPGAGGGGGYSGLVAGGGAGAAALRGAEVAFASDLPRSAGLSSSTALIIGIFAVLSEANALERHPAYIANIPNREALAAYLGCIENGATFGTLVGDSGVGTKGGSQDHTAVLCSEAGQLVGHAYVPARRERVVPMPAGHIFAVASSGVAAEKTGDARDAYNRAAMAAAALVELWQDNVSMRDDGTLYEIVTGRGGAAGVAAPDWFDAAIVTELREIVARVRHPDFSPDALTARLDQFVLETFQIIPAAADTLARGDLAAFGGLVDRSQAAAELWLGNQIPETIALARLARLEGAAAASAFGAGFGGSVWALVEASGADAFLDAWRSRYLANFPERAARAEFFLTAAGPALFQIEH